MSHQSSARVGDQLPVPSTFDSASKLVAALIGIVAIVVGTVAGVYNPLLNRASSTQGTEIDTLFSLLLGIAAAIFVIVQGFLVYSIVRFARAPDDESDGPPIRGNVRLEVLWTTIQRLSWSSSPFSATASWPTSSVLELGR